jgi:preprotein translocase subunit Sec63
MRWLLLALLVALVLIAMRRLRLPRPADGRHPAWDPHAILGVPRDATREQIIQAYHDAIKRYHPDRVADLGQELRHLAHEKTLELRRAYEELTSY